MAIELCDVLFGKPKRQNSGAWLRLPQGDDKPIEIVQVATQSRQDVRPDPAGPIAGKQSKECPRVFRTQRPPASWSSPEDPLEGSG